jgi:uncharacterized protein CbrC (UPF0167 family)
MMTDKPHFRFHPGAYERGAFVQSTTGCGVCGRPCVWLYDGMIYTAGGKPTVCARCIADGSLAGFLEGSFGLHDADFHDDVDDDLAEEVMQRTPGFVTFNAFEWPVRDGKPLAFFGHAEEDIVWTTPEAAEAVRKLYRDEQDEELEGRTSYAVVFKEVGGPRYVAALDLD